MATYNERTEMAQANVDRAAEDLSGGMEAQSLYLAAAQVHATLALAEATMLLVRQGGQR